MATNNKEIAVDLSPLFRLYTDGSITRFLPPQFLPPSDDPNASVRSKDVIIQPETALSVRIFAPRHQTPPQKLPIVIYIHGGAFCIGSSSSTVFHTFTSTLAEKANAIVISIDYRLAPENPLPIAFDDCWTAFKWIAAHADGKGSDPWINLYGDFNRVFLGGESAGATIANDVAVRSGLEKVLDVIGIFLIHPFFGGKEVDKLYKFLCPTSQGTNEDPRIYPAAHPRIKEMVGRRVIFFLAEKDFLVDRGREYYEGLKKSEWNGEVEIFESEGEGHCFHLFNPNCEKAMALVNRLVVFLTCVSNKL